MIPSQNLARLGITLPPLIPPSGHYAHATRSGNWLFLAGKGVGQHRGKIGAEITLDQARDFARSTTLMLLAVIQAELGSLDRVSRILKLNGYLNAAPDFSDHPQVMDASSELLYDIFGEHGLAARTSIGVASTPDQIPLEIEAIIEIAP